MTRGPQVDSKSFSVIRLRSLPLKRKLELSISLIILLSLAILIFVHSNSEDKNQAHFSLLIGISLGVLLERGRFCFFCIFRDAIEYKNATPLLSVLAAIATGAIGYFIIFGQFLPNPKAGYLPPVAHIGPVSFGLVFAAIAFGLGMALSGACISGHLYRIGQGSLRAIPALLGAVLGFALAFLTWNWIYLNLIAGSPTIWFPKYIGYWNSLILTLVILFMIAVFLIKKYPNSEAIAGAKSYPTNFSDFYTRLIKDRWSPLLTGSLVGIVGTIAYLRVEPLGVTRQIGTIARTALDSSGLGPERLEGLDVMAGCIAIVSQAITNNGWLIIGILLTSTALSLAGNRTKIGGLTRKNLLPTFFGGALLGWGGMTALGCTIGVLLSSTQSFALSGWVFFGVVFLTVVLAIKLRLHTI